MDRKVADILNFALFIILIALGTMLGSIALVDSHISLSTYSETYEDKTASQKYTPSLKEYGTYDGTLTREELILVSQIQDINIPENRSLKMGDEAIAINSLSKGKLKTYGNYAKDFIDTDKNTDTTKVSYIINYDYLNDCYVVEKKVSTSNQSLDENSSSEESEDNTTPITGPTFDDTSSETENNNISN